MAQAKKSEKAINRKILKCFTIATADSVFKSLGDISIDDLFLCLYIKSEDKDITHLIQQYEKQMLLSKIDYDRFCKGLHNFYLDMAEYIKVNGLYKKFFELSYLHYIVFCRNTISAEILAGYQNLLVQQFPYITGTSKLVACGVNDKGKLILVPEIGDYLTEINYEFHMQVTKEGAGEISHEDMMIKLFRKYGYKVNDITDCHYEIVNDQVTTTMLYLMSYFITDDTKDIICRPYRKSMYLVEANRIFEVAECSSLVKDKLVQRQFLLPTTGINVQFANNGDVAELYLKEVVENETIVLLFRIKFTDSTFTSGYYNSTDEVFYDAFKESSHSAITHIPMENIVLQNYLNLTCTLTKEERQELVWFKEVKDVARLSDVMVTDPMVYYEIKDIGVSSKDGVRTRHFDRSKYIAELMNIQPFLRKLPTGAVAGEEAVEVAKKLGIDLPKGYTLVRGFIKQVYRNE